MFKKITKSFSKNPAGAIAGGGIGSAILGPAGTVIGAKLGADSGLGGITDLLMGKKDKGVASGYMPLDPLQQKALGKYGALLDTNTDQVAENANMAKLRQISQGARDAETRAKDLVAQRGLGNSSVGINAILNAGKSADQELANARAELPGMKYDMNVKNLGNATSGIQNILNNRIYNQGREGMGRQGGLFGFAKEVAPSAIGAMGTYFGMKAGMGK